MQFILLLPSQLSLLSLSLSIDYSKGARAKLLSAIPRELVGRDYNWPELCGEEDRGKGYGWTWLCYQEVMQQFGYFLWQLEVGYGVVRVDSQNKKKKTYSNIPNNL